MQTMHQKRDIFVKLHEMDSSDLFRYIIVHFSLSYKHVISHFLLVDHYKRHFYGRFYGVIEITQMIHQFIQIL